MVWNLGFRGLVLLYGLGLRVQGFSPCLWFGGFRAKSKVCQAADLCCMLWDWGAESCDVCCVELGSSWVAV